MIPRWAGRSRKIGRNSVTILWFRVLSAVGLGLVGLSIFMAPGSPLCGSSLCDGHREALFEHHPGKTVGIRTLWSRARSVHISPYGCGYGTGGTRSSEFECVEQVVKRREIPNSVLLCWATSGTSTLRAYAVLVLAKRRELGLLRHHVIQISAGSDVVRVRGRFRSYRLSLTRFIEMFTATAAHPMRPFGETERLR